ncbi:DNA-dependent metalloprotease SPRTN [Rhinophrynus dorsalis]
MDADFLLAIRLQEEYDREEPQPEWQLQNEYTTYPFPSKPNKDVRATAVSARPRDMSVVDPSWELIDPIPDIRALFLQFNDMFFWGKLAGVEVKWSSRMTLCAGVCSYEGRGGLCSIRLSEPLLKLRPRKDLVETLLHEMIHALLFVTHNNKDHDSHGPEFCKHMNRINGLTGAKISVYHSFHDEVDEYRKHWWLCNGPCRNRKPYYGYVKRATNRAPSANDPWWSDHQRTCGGTYIKVKEPENYSQKGKRKNELLSHTQLSKPADVKGKSQGVDIRTVIPFSGMGYKLVDPSKPAAPLKVQSVIPSSAEVAKPLPQHSSVRTALPFLHNITDSTKSVDTKKPNGPKISVANTKVFININGSPIKLPNGANKAVSGQSSSARKWDFPFSNMTQKRISFETPSTSKTTPSTSQATSSVTNDDRPAKRPRMDGTKTLEDFFIKASGGKATKSEVPNIAKNSNGGTAITSSSGSSQSVKVSCPVCRTEVYESKINEHLDSCLASC